MRSIAALALTLLASTPIRAELNEMPVACAPLSMVTPVFEGLRAAEHGEQFYLTDVEMAPFIDAYNGLPGDPLTLIPDRIIVTTLPQHDTAIILYVTGDTVCDPLRMDLKSVRLMMAHA